MYCLIADYDRNRLDRTMRAIEMSPGWLCLRPTRHKLMMAAYENQHREYIGFFRVVNYIVYKNPNRSDNTTTLPDRLAKISGGTLHIIDESISQELGLN